MQTDKIYKGDSYRLWGVTIYTKNGNSHTIENEKKLNNKDFLNYVEEVWRVLK